MATKKAKKATKKVAKKLTKQTTEKVDFSDSINKIKSTAKSINRQVAETAAEIVDDIRENGETFQDVAVKQVKQTINKVAEVATVDNVKKVTKEVNDYTLKTAEEVVDGALANGEKWQKVANKAVKGSLKLAAKQQDIIFDTLETVKGQFAQNAGRFIKIFSKN